MTRHNPSPDLVPAPAAGTLEFMMLAIEESAAIGRQTFATWLDRWTRQAEDLQARLRGQDARLMEEIPACHTPYDVLKAQGAWAAARSRTWLATAFGLTGGQDGAGIQ